MRLSMVLANGAVLTSATQSNPDGNNHNPNWHFCRTFTTSRTDALVRFEVIDQVKEDLGVDVPGPRVVLVAVLRHGAVHAGEAAPIGQLHDEVAARHGRRRR